MVKAADRVNRRLRILFFGTPDYSVPTLEVLHAHELIEVVAVVSQPDRPSGRGKQLSAPAIKARALALNLPVLQPEKIRKNVEFKSSLMDFVPIDFGVVIAFGQILPLSILNFPKFGCLNLHASILPRWRGAAPIQRALLAGDSQTGVTLMQMDKGLDTGPIFTETLVDITKNETFRTLHDKLSMLSGQIASQSIFKVAEQKLVARPQSEIGATYADKIVESEALVDWTQTAASIDRQIRAFDPIPGAYSLIDGLRIKLFAPTVEESSDNFAPGTILSVENGQIRVACKNSLISIEEVQLAGRRRMSVNHFLKGFSLKPGRKFGQQ